MNLSSNGQSCVLVRAQRAFVVSPKQNIAARFQHGLIPKPQGCLGCREILLDLEDREITVACLFGSRSVVMHVNYITRTIKSLTLYVDLCVRDLAGLIIHMSGGNNQVG